MSQFGFYYDNSRCTGCKTCVMACKDYYDSHLDIAYRKVYDVEGGQWSADEGGAYNTDAFLYHLSIGWCAPRQLCIKIPKTESSRWTLRNA